jgi:hypothetical protein
MEVVQTNLSTEELHRIVSFIGYGNPYQSVWLIGFEEGLGNMTEGDTWWNLKARGQFSPIMDLQEAHLTLRQKGKPIDISKEPPTTQVWRWAAKIMRAKEGYADWSEKREVIEYVKNCLGRTSGRTFLTELSPIPNRRNSDKKWESWFRDNVKDLDDKVLQRQSALKSLLASAEPELGRVHTMA